MSWSATWRSGPLSVPAFRLLTAGQFTSNVGDYCFAVALPWLALSPRGNAASLGVILACYGLPRTVFTAAGGWFADRFGPRWVMLASDAVRCAMTALLAVYAADGVYSAASLGPIAAVLGSCSALFQPASFTIMPTLLDRDRLQSGNAVFQGVLQTGQLIGPVIGGGIVASTGPTAAFGVDSASFLVSALSLALIGVVRTRRAPDPGRTPAPGQSPARGQSPAPGQSPARGRAPAPGRNCGQVSGMAATAAPADRPNVWRLLLRARLLQVIFMVSITANFALTGTTEVALPALAHDRFGADGYGIILGCVAVGSLSGTALVTRIGRAVRPAVLIVAAFVTSAVGIALVPVFDQLPGVAVAMFLFGVACGFDSVLSITLLQEWAPDGMLGRVMALIMLASAVSFPLSTAAAGLLTRHLGPESVFPVAGVLLAAAMLGGMTQREFRAFGLRDTADGTAGSLATRPVRPSCRRLRTAPGIPTAPERTCDPPGWRRGHAKVRKRQCPRPARQRYGPAEARGTRPR